MGWRVQLVACKALPRPLGRGGLESSGLRRFRDPRAGAAITLAGGSVKPNAARILGPGRASAPRPSREPPVPPRKAIRLTGRRGVPNHGLGRGRAAWPGDPPSTASSAARSARADRTGAIGSMLYSTFLSKALSDHRCVANRSVCGSTVRDCYCHRRKATLALTPPKPNPLEMACSMRMGRADWRTRSIPAATGSGVSKFLVGGAI